MGILKQTRKRLATDTSTRVQHIQDRSLKAGKMQSKVTYSLQGFLLFELLLGINVVIDEDKTGTSSATEPSLKAHDGHALLLHLHGGAELGPDSSLSDISHLGVDQVNSLANVIRESLVTYDLLPCQERVLQEFTDVENELRICFVSHTK